MEYITEPAKQVPVRYEADVFVAGGSCTGVFAAVRAARLGARVVLVERQNMLGGTATSGLVNIWHSLKDTDYREQVIAGLTAEMTARLVRAGAAELKDDPSVAIRFDPNRLAYELDRLVSEEKITVCLHTLCVGVVSNDGCVQAAFIENKDGRSAVRARFFIDATGDGDLARQLGLPAYRRQFVQPPTPCYFLRGSMEGIPLGKLLREHGAEFGLPDDFGWGGPIPKVDGIELRADCHIFGTACETAEGLTVTETEGRRKTYALIDLINRYTDRNVSVAALCSAAGIRETVHYRTRREAKGSELLSGARYDDAVLNGTYRIDVHDSDGGVTFQYLNGDEVYISGADHCETHSNWREKAGLTGEPARYYQLPFEVLVQEQYDNFIAVGRMLNADEKAFGALRVMVNLNQLGEAAGTAAFLAIDRGVPVRGLDGCAVRALLVKGGSAL